MAIVDDFAGIAAALKTLRGDDVCPKAIADIKDKPKPLLFGIAQNYSPPCVRPKAIACVGHTLSPEATVRLIVYGSARVYVGVDLSATRDLTVPETLLKNSSELIYQVSDEAVEFTAEDVAYLDARPGEIGTYIGADD